MGLAKASTPDHAASPEPAPRGAQSPTSAQSPTTAQEIGITRRQGVARVEVGPVIVPLPNGGVKLGAAADAALARGAMLARNDRAYRPFPPIDW
jgi:hypothetical protein